MEVVELSIMLVVNWLASFSSFFVRRGSNCISFFLDFDFACAYSVPGSLHDLVLLDTSIDQLDSSNSNVN